jgi:predicted PurR-regulated permease PerM
MSEAQRHDLTRIVLMVLFIGGLIAAAFWVLRPFLGAIIWAVMIVVATWPLMRQVQGALWGKRWLAVSAMTLVLLLVLVAPLSAAIGTVVANADLIAGWAKHLRDLKLPSPPSWLASLPLVGESAAKFWQEVATQGVESIADDVAPYAGALTKWFVSQIGTVGGLFIQFLLTVVAAAVMYSHGEEFARWAQRFGARLGGENGEGAVRLSGQAIRGVALGVVVTALVQAAVGGTGLVIAGVPFAAVATALMFLFAVAQVGAVPVLIVPVIWLYWSGSPGRGTFLLVVTIIAGTLDNFLRPILIKKGVDLPFLLIFIGVIGGLIGFGLIGLFIGPVVLAVAHTLLNAWLDKDGAAGA